MNPWQRLYRRLWNRENARWLLSMGLVLLAVSSFRSAIADWNDVPTGSMKPTIMIGDRIAVNKLAYDLKIPFTRTRVPTWGHPARGDIVVCWSPADGARLVKRVIGGLKPGSTDTGGYCKARARLPMSMVATLAREA